MSRIASTASATRTLIAAVGIAIALGLAGCGGSSGNGASTKTSTSTAAAQAQSSPNKPGPTAAPSATSSTTSTASQTTTSSGYEVSEAQVEAARRRGLAAWGRCMKAHGINVGTLTTMTPPIERVNRKCLAPIEAAFYAATHPHASKR
jgi:hypothetical protein